MYHLRLIMLLLLVNLVTVAAAADTTAKLRGPKEFDAPAVTRVGPLSARDTLWRIAEQVRPDPRLNMYQVMYALYLKNPTAFLEQNFNHLNPGSFLDIPSVREILAVNAIEAQRKSENDDRLWAEKIRQATQTKPEEKAARQQDVAKVTQEITEELNRVESQQTEQMTDIRERLGASMANVETIVMENTQLKKQLDNVVSELGNVKGQLDKDSEIQLQLQQLLKQQTELLEQQREQMRKAEEGFNFAETWQKLASSPVGWAIAASLPAIMLLMMVVSIIRRKGRKTAAVVSAATASPTVDPNYRSPLPPLDDSLDFDESSLINLDDSLLNDRMQSSIRLDDDNFAVQPAKKAAADPLDFTDDLLEDSFVTPSVGKGSAEFDLDDLLDEPLDSPSAAPRTEFDANNILSGDDLSSLFANMDDEPAFEAKTEFDPKNILSDNDLSSLFANMGDDDEDPDDIFNQAQAKVQQQAAAEQIAADDATDELLPDVPVTAKALQNAAAEADEFDELLEEIELDIPADDEPQTALDLDDEFDIDALVASTQQQSAAAAPVPVVPAADDDDFDIDSLLAANGLAADNDDGLVDSNDPAQTLTMPDPQISAEMHQFDSSELDAFAESLAEETLIEESQPEIRPAALLEEDEQITELIAADEAELASELDDILSEVAELRAQSQAHAVSLAELELPLVAMSAAEADFAEAELSIADVTAMLSEPVAEAAPPVFAVEQPASNDLDPDEIVLEESEFELGAESAAEQEYLSEFAMHEEAAADLADDSLTTQFDAMTDDLAAAPAIQQGDDSGSVMPDLEELDDNSVSRLYESLSSVERPSKVLDEYPELEIDDALIDDSLLDEAQADEFSTLQELMDQEDFRHQQPLTAVDASMLAELDDLENTNFDELLSELDQFEQATVEPLQEQKTARRVLAELDATDQPSLAQVSDPLHDLPDYVHIDKLLAATEDDEVPITPAGQFNIDVGLADFEDLIAADEVGDVDHADAGYAGKLDLVRAYNEIGDVDSASQLIKEILTSNAPPHVKQEAMELQNS